MKILEISAKLNVGGAQLVAANISKYADDNMRFYYIVFDRDIGEYEADIISRGNVIIRMKEPKTNIIGFFIKLIQVMKKEEFDVVHSHTMFNCGIVMLAGKIAGVPGRISHSHTISDDVNNNFLRKFYKGLMRIFIQKFGTDWLACGVEAGNSLYGNNWFLKYGTVIKNGIDVRKYRYSIECRKKIREQYHLEEKYVIGHVGHYVRVKNQTFLIKLMKLISTNYPNTVLLLFGDGPDRENLKKQIEEQRLTESVFLMGNVNNISEVLSAFDVFVFPSFYEGTPLALIEAQANGLPCVISDSIPNDACLSNNIIKLSLKSPLYIWEETLVRAKREQGIEAAKNIKKKYGTIETSMEKLYSIFRKYSVKRKEV